MSARISNAGSTYLSTAIALPDDQVIACSLWVYFVTLSATSNARIWRYYDTGAGDGMELVLNPGGDTLALFTNFVSITGSLLTAGRWYHLAYARTGNDHVVYLDGRADIVTSQATTINPNQLAIGAASTHTQDARIAQVKVWQTALGLADLAREAQSGSPQHGADLVGWWPLPSHLDLLDRSGQGRDLTATGTFTTEEDPPAARGWTPRFWSLPSPPGAIAITGVDSERVQLAEVGVYAVDIQAFEGD